MPLFRINGNKLNKTRERDIDLEKDIQLLTEKNLSEVFGLEFVASEFNLENFRIDTLAFDIQSQSFVVIEYKKDQSFSIIDQGISYLNTIFRNKADLILEYNEKKNTSLKRESIDWNQTRVIFIAQRFTAHQQNIVGFRDFPIELWEVKSFEKDLILFNQIKPTEVKETIGNISKGKLIKAVTKEIMEYTVEDHRKRMLPNIKLVFDTIRDKVIEIDSSIKEKPVKNYIGYKLSWYNFASIHAYKDKLKIYVRKDKLDCDTDNRFTKIPESYKWGNTPLWWIDVNDQKLIPYVLKAIQESYKSAPDK